MTFIHPIMLVGLAAALVPLVLHLLNRSRYRNVDWAAMMFLDAPRSRQHHSARLKQWALLSARMMVIALLAAALARPLLHPRGMPPTRPGRTAAVILLDRSASMSFNDNGRLRLDLAREAAFQVLTPGLQRGDDLWLVPLGDPAASAPRHATDPQEMARQVREVSTASGVTDIAAALRQAIDLLAGSQAPNREIYLVCDRQANSWRNVDQAFAREWEERVARLPSRPRLFVLPVGTEDFDNVAIESIEPVREPFVQRQPGEIEIRLHNYGTVPRAALPLSVSMRTHWAPNKDVDVKETTVNLAAGVSTSVLVPVTFNEPGSNLITARISAPGLSTDKELRLPIDVLPRIGVLLIDGDEREPGFRTAADFLKLALAPFPGAAARNTAAVTLARPDLWTPGDLVDEQVVVLANVPSFTEVQARALEQFVFAGGGLIIAPGDQTRIDAYNATLPWLPAILLPATAESEAGATAVGAMEMPHPIFRFLRGRPEAASPAVVRRYFPVSPRANAMVIASYNDGKPFVLEAPAGHGRTLLITTPVDTDWNTLPLTSFFLPFAQSAVRYVAAAHPARILLTGQPIVADIDEPVDPRNVKLFRNGVRIPPSLIAISQFGAHSRIRFTDTFTPDIYRLQARGDSDPRALQFVVRTPGEESDLTPLTEARWASLGRELGFKRIDPERRGVAVEQEAFRIGWDLWIPLLGAAILLSILELTATRHWRGRDE